MGTDADVEEIIEVPIVKPKKITVTPLLPTPDMVPVPIFVPVREPTREPAVINR